MSITRIYTNRIRLTELRLRNMRPHKTLLLLLTTLLYFNTQVGWAETQPIPAGWAVYPTPDEGSSTMQCANYSEHEWRVSLSQAGTLQINPYREDYRSLPNRELPFGI